MHPSPPKSLRPVTIRRRSAAQHRTTAQARTRCAHGATGRPAIAQLKCEPALCSPRRGHQNHTTKPRKVAHSCSEEQLAVATFAAASSLQRAADSVEELGAAALRGERRSSAAGCSECAFCAFWEVPSMLLHCASATSTAVFLLAVAFALRSAFKTPAAARPPRSSQKAGGRPPPRAPPWPPFFT